MTKPNSPNGEKVGHHDAPAILTVVGPVATIRLNRPDRRNALTRAMTQLLCEQVASALADDGVRLLVIESSGSVFCAGMDLAEMQQRAEQADGPEQWRIDALVFRDLLLSLLTAKVPVMAVVQGGVVAGGVGIVVACDTVIASDQAFFALPEPQRGITAAMVTPLLAHRVGGGHASHLLLSGRRVPATETMAWGLCHAVVPGQSLSKTRDAWIQSLLAGSPMALAQTKQMLHQAWGADWPSLLEWTAELSGTARETEDAREGLQAFLEKRPPKWQPTKSSENPS